MSAHVLMLCLLLPGIAFQIAVPQTTQSASISSRWLLSYKGKTGFDVAQDHRFLPLLRQGLPHYPLQWSAHHPLYEEVPQAIWSDALGNPSTVSVESDRFVTITGAFPREGDVRGLLWCDIAAHKQPEMIFVLMSLEDVGREGRADLTIYSNRNRNDLPLPPQFIVSVLSWEKDTKITTITKIEIHDAQDHTALLPLSTLSNQ